MFKPNLKGFLVGNGVTNWAYDTTNAFIEMAYWHGLYDTETYEQIKENKCTNGTAATDKCGDLINRVNTLAANINIYDVYGKCYSNNPSNQFELYATKEMGLAKVGNEIKTYKKTWSAHDYTPFLFNKNLKHKQVAILPPCVYGTPIINYFNSDVVRKLLHIPDDVQAFDFCTDKITYNIPLKGSQWVYEELQGKYKMIHFSGDTDGAVPTFGTMQWINELNWNIKDAWRPYFVDGQVAGYIEERDGLTFATVHGAGHMAPQWKRPQTYHLIFNWLKNEKI